MAASSNAGHYFPPPHASVRHLAAEYPLTWRPSPRGHGGRRARPRPVGRPCRRIAGSSGKTSRSTSSPLVFVFARAALRLARPGRRGSVVREDYAPALALLAEAVMVERRHDIAADVPLGNALGAVVICLQGRYILGSTVAVPAGPSLPATLH